LRNRKEQKRFARMFLNHVGDERAQKAIEELALVKTVMDKDAGVRGLFVGPQFAAEEKNAMLDHLRGKASLSEGTCKFISHLIEAESMALVPGILDAAIALYMERARRAKAVVMAAVEPDRAYMDRLRASLRRITEREVEIEYVRDPSVIGGLLVKVGSTMFDGSLKGQLRLLKEDLIKG
jgi:ATP synthase F1 delta subunit